MRFLSRRDFLRDSALGAAGLALGHPLLRAAEKAAKKGDANDTLHVAVVGVHGRGMAHVGGFLQKSTKTVITHVCDCDTAVIGPAMKKVEDAQKAAPKYEQDFRRLLDDKSIDIISIATPNHWHALMAVWALQAGKHVYVEKPVSHNVSEGRRIVEAARRHNRLCQAGTQCRSMSGMREAIAFVQSGGIGKVSVARGLCYKSRPSIGKVSGEQPIPKTIDYDLWCGPAAKLPLTRKNLHYDWHWVWNTGNGDLGNQGIHQMDLCRWGLGKGELAKSVLSVGGRFGYVDDGQTPNTQVAVFDYGDAELIFEVRGLPTKDYKGAKVGVVFHGSDGYLVCSSYDSGTVYDKDGKEVKKFTTPKGKNGDGGHFANFVQAVRDGKPEELNGEILEGHLSSALCHLANVSYRVGSEQPYSKTSKAFGDDKAAAETLERTAEHLKDNRVPQDGTNYRVGRRLTVDVKNEAFVGDKEADALLTREYRAPFVMPKTV
ncbi:MAG TPA: Gfo/Idh/MocA family oxidoreductase [Gemmataceae bacterium]|nr:Gfo/Idh/MocA family oxidoreductase [Gemmataceae bacterium]